MTQLKFRGEIPGQRVRFEFRGRRTGEVVEVTIPFPLTPDEAEVYQALKALIFAGVLEMGGMEFEDCGEDTERPNSQVDAEFDPELN